LTTGEKASTTGVTVNGRANVVASAEPSFSVVTTLAVRLSVAARSSGQPISLTGSLPFQSPFFSVQVEPSFPTAVMSPLLSR
jgi:hypothetical protein